jgi:hypothetical protein
MQMLSWLQMCFSGAVVTEDIFESSMLTDMMLCSVQAGCEPILHMRHFQKTGSLSDKLVQDIVTRNA